MARVAEGAWRPSGIADFEPAAWHALRRIGSTAVVAGPGAGKTEFLAQRAVYLLETGLCPAPYQILAISFKGDAAKNLADRVAKRCPPELAKRFVSMTFDAFTKSLVDRFHMALPTVWRPTTPYEIAFPSRQQVNDFLTRTARNAPNDWGETIRNYDANLFEAQQVGSVRLPISGPMAYSPLEFAVYRWWANQLPHPLSSLSFICLNRLAELLLRAAPHISRALRITYPFIFIDEFQDTTYSQYDFLLSAFNPAEVSVTAVGDNKQRIMGWAGAKTDAFERFQTDYSAEQVRLLYNFRSSPELVRVQHVIAQALDAGTAPAMSQAGAKLDKEIVQIWNCESRAQEVAHLAAWIANDIAERRTHPRDYALLVRQRADAFDAELKDAFATVGLGIRNESHLLGNIMLQDLLAEEIVKVTVSLLRLGTGIRSAEAWRCASAALEMLRAIAPDDERGAHRCDTELSAYLKSLRQTMAASPPSEVAAEVISNHAFNFLAQEAIVRSYVQYARNDLLSIVQAAFVIHMQHCASDAATWEACLDQFEGIDLIPLMTVHKSKGLEYDTIAFIGLDDQSWWSHSAGNPEGIATFFVALSRAKQRAIFMFCQQRGTRQRVADIYQLLTDAGVQEFQLQ